MGKLTGAFKRAAVWVLGTVLTVGAIFPSAALAQDDLKPGTCYTAHGRESAREVLASATSKSGYVAVVVGRTPGYNDAHLVYVKSKLINEEQPGLYDGGIRVTGKNADDKGNADEYCITNTYQTAFVPILAGMKGSFIPSIARAELKSALIGAVNSGETIIMSALTSEGTLEIIVANLQGPNSGEGSLVSSDSKGVKPGFTPLIGTNYSKSINTLTRRTAAAGHGAVVADVSP